MCRFKQCFFLCLVAVNVAAAPIGISRVTVQNLNPRDRALIDSDTVFLQFEWNLKKLPKLSKFQVAEAKSGILKFEFQARAAAIPVVELRHANISGKRRLLVMSAGLFASEWDDLNSAKWFYDQGFDVLKVPTGFSESFVRAFPHLAPGDIAAESEILTLAVSAYRIKYGVEAQGQQMIGFGTSYGATVLLKTAERFPNYFDRLIVTGPIYDFTYAMQVFDGLMLGAPALASRGDAERGERFLMTVDPQTLVGADFEPFAKTKIAEFMVKKIQLYCWIRSDAESRDQCKDITSFSGLITALRIKVPSVNLVASQNPRVHALTTLNDPLNRSVVPIGRTVALEKGGHFGFIGTDLERTFIKDALDAK